MKTAIMTDSNSGIMKSEAESLGIFSRSEEHTSELQSHLT